MSTRMALTWDETERILASCLGGREVGRARPRAVRDWALVMTLLETGLRAGEAWALNIDDCLYAGVPVRSLVVRSGMAKGGRERLVPVSERLEAAWRRMAALQWLTPAGPGPYPAWTVGVLGRRLSIRRIEAIVARYGEEALHRMVWPHLLRHTFATRIERVAGIRVAQELLGHADIRTTQIYTHPGGEELRAAIDDAGRAGPK